MLYVKPDYYEKFQCTADKCEDTCCAGWQIVIDDASLEQYKSVTGSYEKILQERIDYEQSVFMQDKHKRCAFLDEENLCDMYKQLGEESLCHTCTTYPRHIEEFEDVREITLSISCPEVAHILLNQKSPVCYLEKETDEEETEDFEDFDFIWYSYLVDAREKMVYILQNRKWDLESRIAMVWQMAEELQSCADDMQLFSCGEVIERYAQQQDILAEETKKTSQEFLNKSDDMYQWMKRVYGCLFELELLNDSWEEKRCETWDLLYSKNAEEYMKIRNGFVEYLQKLQQNESTQMDIPDYVVMLEQLVIYFLYTYMCGAVYDGNILSKVKLSVVSVICIFEMWMAEWKKNEAQLDFDSMVQIVYRYSRELEHSDWNLDTMEEIVEKL